VANELALLKREVEQLHAQVQEHRTFSTGAAALPSVVASLKQLVQSLPVEPNMEFVEDSAMGQGAQGPLPALASSTATSGTPWEKPRRTPGSTPPSSAHRPHLPSRRDNAYQVTQTFATLQTELSTTAKPFHLSPGHTHQLRQTLATLQQRQLSRNGTSTQHKPQRSLRGNLLSTVHTQPQPRTPRSCSRTRSARRAPLD
jgi:hypothetical protein